MQQIRDVNPGADKTGIPAQAPAIVLPGFSRWAAGIAGVWVGLALLAEFESTRPLAVTLGWAVVGGVVLGNGPHLAAALKAAGQDSGGLA